MHYCLQARVGTHLIGVSALLYGLHEEERAQRCSQRLQREETKEEAPEHPYVRALMGTMDDAIIQVAEQVYQGEWTLVPSMLSCHQHDKCMRELQQGLNRQMSRASLQEAQGTQ